MTRLPRTLFALAVIHAAHPGLAAPTHAEIQAVAERQVCESTGVTHVVFAGYSSQLAECASACANYLLPAAQRLRVETGSYVLLHGSMSQRDAAGMHDSIRLQLREQLKQQAAELPETAIEDLARQTIGQLHADLEAHIPVQDEFARATLACDDWLDMWPHFGNQAPPEGVLWTLVTPEMAGRCLKSTKIESFWAPEAQEAFESKLGFFRARK